MRRLAAIACALLLCASTGRAGGGTREVVIADQRIPNRVCILVDRSGSMSLRLGPDPTDASKTYYSYAVREAMWIAQQVGDEGWVRFYAFHHAYSVDPQGWIELPDKEKLDKAKAWLLYHEPTGGTEIPKAVQVVMEQNPEDPLGIVIVTDGDPDAQNQIEQAAEIKALNAARATPAMLMTIIIEPRHDREDKFGEEAARGDGIYIRVKARKPVELETK